VTSNLAQAFAAFRYINKSMSGAAGTIYCCLHRVKHLLNRWFKCDLRLFRDRIR